jgi:hypothetical protein
LGAGLLFGDVEGGWNGRMVGAGRDCIEIFSERTQRYQLNDCFR